MEIKIMWDHSWIADRISPSAPFFNGCPPILCGNMHMKDIAMTTAYDGIMAVEPVNLCLLAALCEICPDGVASLRSEQLKRKWAPQEEELFSNEAKRAKLVAAVEKNFLPEELLKLQAKLSSCEEHLAKLVVCLALRVEVRGTALPNESGVLGCMLLDLLTTSAMSPSELAAFFLAP